jgi:hypothetical protein
MSILLEKTLNKYTFEDEIPNETTIKAMEEEELFSYDSAEEMITDCLDGDESWKNPYKNIYKIK